MTVKRFSYLTIGFFLVLIVGLAEFPVRTNAQQSASSALGRGFRTGYTDGFDNGFADSADNAQRDFSKKPFYRSADRAYSDSYGSLDDYKDGYRQGFESGYNAGFDHRQFDSTVPDDLHRRNSSQVSSRDNSSSSNGPPQVVDNSTSTSKPDRIGGNGNGNSSGGLNLPANASLRIVLMNDISTDASQRGDPFQARVIEPANLKGAIIQGHLSLVKRPGKIRGSGELQLAFDRITPEGGVAAPFNAQVVEVLTKADKPAGTVDSEGAVKGQDSTKDSAEKIGAGTGVGAAIGAIASGGKGALIGAAIGGGASTGGVLMTHGKDLRLQAGQELRIQTSKEIRF